MVAVIAASLVVGIYFALNNTSPYQKFEGKPVSASILKSITGVNDSTLTSIGVPVGVKVPVAVSGSALTLNGKPEILYIGGNYCPYCAVERWSLIMALSRFGQFSGLTYMLSSSTDVNPNTPTFSFSSATYTSSYVAFVGVEEFGGDPNTVIQTLTSQQQSLVSQYDTCAASGGSGGIPFVDIANAYAINCGAQNLLDISNKNWTDIAPVLNTPGSNVAQLIDGSASTLITAICHVDGQKPSSVCSQPYATVPLSYASSGASGAIGAFAAVPASRGRGASSA